MHFASVKGILSAKNGMNLFRGCIHGCIYCDSRSKCYRMEHRFEDVEVKENSLKLLDDALGKRRKKCMVGMGSMTDPYIPEELKLKYTRGALEIILKHGFGLSLITKSANLLRDLDLFEAINKRAKCVIQMTLTTYDEALCKKVEPNVSTTKERFEALKILRDAGIPTVVWLTPILPFINDTEENLLGILNYCKEASVHGILCFGMGLTLREGNREYFYAQLDKDFPKLKEIYIKRYGKSYIIDSPKTGVLMPIFHKFCRENKIVHDNREIFNYLHSFEERVISNQLNMFDMV